MNPNITYFKTPQQLARARKRNKVQEYEGLYEIEKRQKEAIRELMEEYAEAQAMGWTEKLKELQDCMAPFDPDIEAKLRQYET